MEHYHSSWGFCCLILAVSSKETGDLAQALKKKSQTKGGLALLIVCESR